LVGHHRVNLFIESTLEAAVCPTCQQVSTVIHDQGAPLFIRDLSIWNRRCWLSYGPRRFECATCQATFVERLVWREPNREYTQRYEQAIFERARREPTSQIAQAEQLSEDQVHGIFERWAKKR
jgi:transposase